MTKVAEPYRPSDFLSLDDGDAPVESFDDLWPLLRPHRPLDTASFTFGLTSVVLVLGVVAAKVAGSAPAEEWSILLFGLIGFGSAPLQLVPGMRGTRFTVTAIGLGLGIVSLTGFLLVELGLWAAGTGVFVVFALVATVLHAGRLFRDVRRLPPRCFRDAVGRGQLGTVASLAVLICSFAGLGVCLATSVVDEHLIPKPGGLPTSISPVWFLGLLLTLAAFFMAWKWRPVLVGTATVVVVLVFTATPSIVYDIARYDWTQAHVGLTAYFLQHGNGGNPSVYQAWPGFFGGIAWLMHAGGVSNVEGLARWWPPIVDVVGAILVRCLAQVFDVSRRNAWLAALLFTAANTIGQDYYSPQAMAYIEFLVMLTIAVRPQTTKGTWGRSDSSVLNRLNWITLVVLGLALAVSHPLTPFVLSGMFVILAIFGLLRSRWMILVPSVPAVAWALVHTSLISQYINLSDIGNVGANLQSPSTSFHYHYDIYAHIGDLGQAAAPFILGYLALVALWVRRDRVAWALVTCAASTGVLVVAVHYGNEDVFRAALFALPLLAVMAVRVQWHTTRLRSAAIATLIPVIALYYVIGDMGFDYIYVLRPSDMSVVRHFENKAPSGSTLISVSDEAYTPVESTARYQSFVFDYLNLPQLLKEDGNSDAGAVSRLSTSTGYNVITTDQQSSVVPTIFLATMQQAAAQWSEGGVVSLDGYRSFNDALAHSPHWKIVDRTPTATLYRFVTSDLNLKSHPHLKSPTAAKLPGTCPERLFTSASSPLCLISG